MKTYEVVSPYLVFSVKEKDGKAKEYSLKKGSIVELPETSSTVQVLLARKQLREKSKEQIENKQQKVENKQF
jgi:hypothetical protein